MTSVDQVAFLRKMFVSEGQVDDQTFTQWEKQWTGTPSFAEHLVSLGVLNQRAVSMLPMMMKGYANVPITTLLGSASLTARTASTLRVPPPESVVTETSNSVVSKQDLLSSMSKQAEAPLVPLAPTLPAPSFVRQKTMPGVPLVERRIVAPSNARSTATMAAITTLEDPIVVKTDKPIAALSNSHKSGSIARNTTGRHVLPVPAAPVIVPVPPIVAMIPPQQSIEAAPKDEATGISSNWSIPESTIAELLSEPMLPIEAALMAAIANEAMDEQLHTDGIPTLVDSEDSLWESPNSSELSQQQRMSGSSKRIRAISQAPDRGIVDLQGTRLGQFELLQLARGRRGSVVYNAVVASTSEPISIMLLQKLSDFDTRSLLARLVREIPVLTKIHSALLVNVVEHGLHHGCIFVACSNVQPLTARGLVDRVGPIPARRVMQLGYEIAQFLASNNKLPVLWPSLDPDDILIGSSDLRPQLWMPALNLRGVGAVIQYSDRLQNFAATLAFLIAGKPVIAEDLKSSLPIGLAQALIALAHADIAKVPNWQAVVELLSEAL
jgi:hypothetical protein